MKRQGSARVAFSQRFVYLVFSIGICSFKFQQQQFLKLKLIIKVFVLHAWHIVAMDT